MSTNEVTLDAVEQEEARARSLAAEIEQLREREGKLSEALAEAHATRGNVQALMAERRECVELREDMEAALPLLRKRIEERREQACRAAGERRLLAVVRAAGSLADHCRRDLERIERLVSVLVAEVERRNERQRDLERLHLEAEALAARFGLPKPRLPTVTAPAQDPAAAAVLKPMHAAAFVSAGRPFDLSGEVRIEPVAGGVRIVGLGGKRNVDGATGEILAAAGAWTRTREQVEQDRALRVVRDEERRQEARDRVDQWLRGQLANGPAAREKVMQAAREAGIPFAGSGDTSVYEARKRLDVRVVHRLVRLDSGRVLERDTSADYWALPGGWSEEEWVEYDGPVDSLAGMRA